MTDEQLLRDDFDALVNRYRDFLVSYVAKRSGPALAAEVTDAVFARMAQHRATFKPEQLFRPWMYLMADRMGRLAAV